MLEKKRKICILSVFTITIIVNLLLLWGFFYINNLKKDDIKKEQIALENKNVDNTDEGIAEDVETVFTENKPIIEEIDTTPEDITDKLMNYQITDLNSKISFYDKLNLEFDRADYDEDSILRNSISYIRLSCYYNPKYSEVGRFDEGDYGYVSSAIINEISNKLFGITVSERDYFGKIEIENIYFKDGEFKYALANGTMLWKFSLIDKVIDNKNGTYDVEFTIYEVINPEEYSFVDNSIFDKNKYELSTEKYRPIKKGTVVMDLESINGEECFRAIKFNRNDLEEIN